MPLTTAFREQSIYRMDESSRMIEKCFRELTEAETWKKPNEASNSIGTLIIHLCGNMTQYVLSALGHTEDNRQRDLEFATLGGYSKAQLLEKLFQTVEKVKSVIQRAGEDDLQQIFSVQGYRLPGIGIVLHVVEHYSYHTGQIALLTKLFKNKDLGFYAGVDLNAKNKM